MQLLGEPEASVSGAGIDHNGLANLTVGDVHTQYLNTARGDARYFPQSSFINVSAGAGDAAKPVILDAAGLISNSMLGTSAINHNGLANLTVGDVHTQYLNAARGDARYFPQSSFINVSAGAGDAAKPVILDAAGLISNSMLGTSAINHNGLANLTVGDVHTQYLNTARGDARYFQQSSFINVSAGAGDAAKPVILDAAGLISNSMLGASAIDHNSLANLTAGDVHTQYARTDGSRNITGSQTFNANVDITSGTLDVGGLATFDGSAILDSASPDLIVGDGTGSSDIVLRKSNAGTANINWQTDTGGGLTSHWSTLFQTNEALLWLRRDLNGNFVDTPLSLSWTTGNATFGNDIAAVDGTFSGNVDITSGTLDVGGLATFDGNMILDSASPILTVGDGTGAPNFVIDKVGTSEGGFEYRDAGVLRWRLIMDTSEDWRINSYSAAGAFQRIALEINATSGNAVFAADVSAVDGTFTGNVDITTGTLDVGGLATFDGDAILDSASPTLTVGDGSAGAAPDLVIDSGTGAGVGELYFRENGSDRYLWRFETDSSYRLGRFNGAGAFQGWVMIIDQAAGDVVFGADISAVDGTFSGNVDITSGTLDVGGLATFDGNVILDSASPTLTVGDGSAGTPALEIVKADASESHFDWMSNTFMRWQLRLNTAENLVWRRFDATGASLGDMVTYQNSNGRVTFSNDVHTGGAVFLNSTNAILTVGDGTGDPQVILNKGSSADSADIVFQEAGSDRWAIRVDTDTADTFQIERYNGSGALQDVPLSIDQAAGDVLLANSLTVDGKVIEHPQLAGNPTGTRNGSTYWNTAVGKLRVLTAAGWTDLH